MEKQDQYLGHFLIQGRRMAGQVTLKGKDSRFEVFADDHIHVPREKMRTIRGVARSGEKITICDAIGAEFSGHSSYYGTSRHFLSLFPHHVAIGPRHVDVNQKVISEICFTTSGAVSLFYDNGAFGMSHGKTNVRRFMPDWAKKDRRKILHSQVFYYADRGPIASVSANDLEITVFNAVGFSFPSPQGINVGNEVRIALKFKRPQLLNDALASAYDFRLFFEVLSQTKQCIRGVELRHKNSGDRERFISLYTSYEETEPGRATDFRDNLVSGGLNRHEFKTVLTRWIRSHAGHRGARQRVVQSMREETYTIDRLIGAANAFDLLPSSAKSNQLPLDIVKTLAKLAKDAKTLKPPYRDQVLSNLHRVKSQTLRQKIIAKFKSLPKSLQALFPEMALVIDHCVKARNYFVHGTAAKLSAEAIDDQIFFLTDTLEFIFFASELNDCGWKFERWLKEANMGRLREYVRSYEMYLKAFKVEVGIAG